MYLKLLRPRAQQHTIEINLPGCETFVPPVCVKHEVYETVTDTALTSCGNSTSQAMSSGTQHRTASIPCTYMGWLPPRRAIYGNNAGMEDAI